MRGERSKGIDMAGILFEIAMSVTVRSEEGLLQVYPSYMLGW